MEEQSYVQVRSFWPDVAGPFSRVVPDGCSLLAALDAWNIGLRRRALSLARGAKCPSIGELIEEAREDAERRGWTPVDELSTEEEPVLELEEVILRIGAGAVALTGGSVPVLRVSFDQKWPADAGAPVETSEMFQNLVRKLLRLGSEPERLAKELVVDRADAAQIESLRETVELAVDHALERDLLKVGFLPKPGDATEWSSRTNSGIYEISARVVLAGGRAEIAMTKQRVAN